MEALRTEAAIAALDAFSGRVTTLISGGHDRGYDFSELAKRSFPKAFPESSSFPSPDASWRKNSKKRPKQRKRLQRSSQLRPSQRRSHGPGTEHPEWRYLPLLARVAKLRQVQELRTTGRAFSLSSSENADISILYARRSQSRTSYFPILFFFFFPDVLKKTIHDTHHHHPLPTSNRPKYSPVMS